jgi:hypothetical protein
MENQDKLSLDKFQWMHSLDEQEEAFITMLDNFWMEYKEEYPGRAKEYEGYIEHRKEPYYNKPGTNWMEIVERKWRTPFEENEDSSERSTEVNEEVVETNGDKEEEGPPELMKLNQQEQVEEELESLGLANNAITTNETIIEHSYNDDSDNDNNSAEANVVDSFPSSSAVALHPINNRRDQPIRQRLQQSLQSHIQRNYIDMTTKEFFKWDYIGPILAELDDRSQSSICKVLVPYMNKYFGYIKDDSNDIIIVEKVLDPTTNCIKLNYYKLHKFRANFNVTVTYKGF